MNNFTEDNSANKELTELWEQGASGEQLGILRSELIKMRQVEVPQGLKASLVQLARKEPVKKKFLFLPPLTMSRFAPVAAGLLIMFVAIGYQYKAWVRESSDESLAVAVRAESVLEEILPEGEDNIFDSDISPLEITL